MTEAQMKARIAELEAELSAKNAKQFTVGHSEYGSGTVTIKIAGYRHPVSLYPAIIDAMISQDVLKQAQAYAKTHANALRACAYAAEKTADSGVVWNTKSKENTEFKAAYDPFRKAAVENPVLKSSKWA